MLRVTITPDWDDGPRRYGDTQVGWPRRRFTGRELGEKLVLVALAGPVAEMIYRGEPLHPATVSEWADDWRQASEEASPWVPDARLRTRWLEGRVIGLHGTLGESPAWEAIAGVADHLLAHETLEQDAYEDLIQVWLR